MHFYGTVSKDRGPYCFTVVRLSFRLSVIFGMKAYLNNMHLLVPRSRSSAKVKVKYKGYVSQKMAVSGAFVFHKHILFVGSSTNAITRERVI